MPKQKTLSGWSSTLNAKTTGIPHEAVLSYFHAVWKEANDYWEAYVGPEWKKNDMLYQDRYELPFQRMNWQSDLREPIVDSLVTRITYFLHRNLLGIATQEDYFTVNHPKAERGKAYRALLRAVLKDNEYPNVFARGFAKSLVNSIMVTKIVYINERKTVPSWDKALNKFQGQTEKILGRTKVIYVDPYHIRLDPYGDRYIIELVPRVPYSEFLKAARANKWRNLDVVKDEVFTNAAAGTKTHLPFVNLKYVYTKSFTNEYGEEVASNAFFVVVNDTIVVHFDNYYMPDGRFPYTYTNPMIDLYSRYGRPYVSKIADLVRYYVGMVNLAMDGAYLSALGLHEYDTEVARDDTAHSFTGNIEPGKMYPKQGNGSVLNSIFPPAQQAMSLLQPVFFLDREIQNKGYVNEFFAGQPTAKGRPTLGEVNLKTQESSAFFTDMATHVESQKVAKDLELILYTELMNLKATQKLELYSTMDDTSAGVLKSLTPEEIQTDIEELRIEVTGISGKIKRQANFNRYLQIFNVIGNMPGVQSSMLIADFVRKMFGIIDDAPEEVLDMSALVAIQTQMQQQQQVQLTQPQGGANPAPPTGGAPQEPAPSV